jgi:hypothetical protein
MDSVQNFDSYVNITSQTYRFSVYMCDIFHFEFLFWSTSLLTYNRAMVFVFWPNKLTSTVQLSKLNMPKSAYFSPLIFSCRMSIWYTNVMETKKTHRIDCIGWGLSCESIFWSHCNNARATATLMAHNFCTSQISIVPYIRIERSGWWNISTDYKVKSPVKK